MLLNDLVRVSEALSATRSRRDKTRMLSELLGRLSPDEAPAAVSYLAGKPRQEPLGVGYATVFGLEVPPAPHPTLSVLEVDRSLAGVAETSGPGTKRRRDELLTDLFGRATDSEQDFLRGLILRNLRQGALEGVMADAVAQTLGVRSDTVRRAAMLEGDLVAVAARALAEPESLDQARLRVFTAVQPMLAKTADSAGEGVATLGCAIVEWKLDGARIQVHRQGDRVEIYTRNLRQITDSVQELVEEAQTFAAESFILDGEALLFGPGGTPMVFQESMSRFGSEEVAGHPPLRARYFDILHLNGDDMIDKPLSDRRRALAETLGDEARLESIVTRDPDAADRFFAEAVAAGYEGVVVKDPTQPYEAGRRGSSWLKVKPTYTLDLVVLAAEWGSGRRQGWLSNLHLGARHPDGGYVMLGKTFKGLTDEMLEWQTARFLELEDHREGHAVYLRPETVYEVAFDGVQRSTRYPGGVALRFARVKRFRDDKRADDADTLDTVRSFLR